MERFHHYVALKAAEPLCERLSGWSEKHLPVLKNMPPYKQYDFPPNLSPRRQDICEPLLQLAHLVGGPWPARLGEALITTFAEEADFHLQHSRQLLADLRDCFAAHGFPERIQTTTLLDWLHSLPARPWDSEGSLSAYKLARMLGPFAIRARNQRIGKGGKPLRGYQLEHFREAWKKHLSFDLPQSEIASNDAACNTVSRAGTPSSPSQTRAEHGGKPQENPEWSAAPGCVLGSPSLKNGREEESVGNAVTPARPAAPPSKPAKNAVCDTISHAPTVSIATKTIKSEIPNQNPETSNPTTNQKPQVPAGRGPKIINKNASCGTISHAHAAPAPTQTIKSEIANQKSEISVETLHGIHRLKTLHSKLRLQGLCPPFEALAASYSPHQLHAALDWVEAHPEWCANLRYKPALEFVVAFQKTLAVLTMKGA